MSTVQKASWFNRFDHWLEVQLGLRANTKGEKPQEKVFTRNFSEYNQEKDRQINHFSDNPSGDFSYSSIFFTDIFFNDTTRRQVYETDSVIRIGSKKYRIIIRNTVHPQIPQPVSLNDFPEHESENQQYALYISNFDNNTYGRGEGIIYTASKPNGGWDHEGRLIPELISSRLIHKLNSDEIKQSGDPIKDAINWLRNDYFQEKNTEWFQFN